MNYEKEIIEQGQKIAVLEFRIQELQETLKTIRPWMDKIEHLLTEMARDPIGFRQD